MGLLVLRVLRLAVVGALMAASPAWAQPIKKQPVDVQGKIVKVGQDFLVVETRDKQEVKVYHTPETRFLMNNKVVKLSDVRVGTNVAAAYVVEGDRWIANTVTLVAIADQGTLLEGEIVKVVGEEQIIVRTPERKEVIVFVNPQTTYTIDDRTVKFTELRPGIPINVYYDVRGDRFTARRVLSPVRRK